MAAQKRRFTGPLRKPIRLDEAKPGPLNARFVVPPDKYDFEAHLRTEYKRKYAELDKFFGLPAKAENISELRAKALVAHVFGIEPHDKGWWTRFEWCLVRRYVPGFRIKKIGEKKSGRPRKWNDDLLAEVFADVEFLRRKTKLSVRNICAKVLTKGKYKVRWGHFTANMLRRAYAEAKARRKSDLRFELLLCGLGVTVAGKRIDRIEAAIQDHALRE